jgi:hypothetical protein
MSPGLKLVEYLSSNSLSFIKRESLDPAAGIHGAMYLGLNLAKFDVL